MFQTIKYNMKVCTLGGLMTFGVGARYASAQTTATEPQKHNIEIYINGTAPFNHETNINNQLTNTILAKYNADQNIDTIFIIPYNKWEWGRGGASLITISSVLKQKIKLFPKIFGRGNWDCDELSPEEMKQQPEYIQQWYTEEYQKVKKWYQEHGWTIGKEK